SKPDALAVIDVKPTSPTFSQIVHTVTMPHKGVRVPSFWLERLLIRVITTHRPCISRTALPDHPRDPVLAHLYHRYEAGSDQSEDSQDHRTRAIVQKDWLLAAPYGPLRAGRHLRKYAWRRRQRWHHRSPRYLHHGLR